VKTGAVFVVVVAVGVDRGENVVGGKGFIVDVNIVRPVHGGRAESGGAGVEEGNGVGVDVDLDDANDEDPTTELPF